MKPKNPSAVALGKLNRGVPKNLSESERARRRERARTLHTKRKPPVPSGLAAMTLAAPWSKVVPLILVCCLLQGCPSKSIHRTNWDGQRIH
jgi:hypothetical protein